MGDRRGSKYLQPIPVKYSVTTATVLTPYKSTVVKMTDQVPSLNLAIDIDTPSPFVSDHRAIDSAPPTHDGNTS